MTAGQLQEQVRRELQVAEEFDAAAEAQRRVSFLADYLRTSGASGYVLGISGGVDSSVTGRLAQLACEQVGATFTAVRLPYGVQADEADAQAALAFIGPGQTLTIDIGPATDALHRAVTLPAGYASPAAEDFVKGNTKARMRMSAQFAVAGALGAIVLGTDHAAEAVMGFYTKFGDGACDVAPLFGLNKRRVRALGAHLGAPSTLTGKTPTADLEDDRPGVPDELVLGVTYDQIDDYLEGRDVGEQARSVIEAAYLRTAHKRALPVTVPPAV
ncbi:MAG: nadE [Frankiales bacterium]|nr:nadE [Frankiales bacterium]